MQQSKTNEGTINLKYQITIPAVMRDALGLQPGDKIEFRLEAGNVLELRVKRPKPSETIAAILEQFDVSALHNETAGDAVSAVRTTRQDDE